MRHHADPSSALLRSARDSIVGACESRLIGQISEGMSGAARMRTLLPRDCPEKNRTTRRVTHAQSRAQREWSLGELRTSAASVKWRAGASDNALGSLRPRRRCVPPTDSIMGVLDLRFNEQAETTCAHWHRSDYRLCREEPASRALNTRQCQMRRGVRELLRAYEAALLAFFHRGSSKSFSLTASSCDLSSP